MISKYSSHKLYDFKIGDKVKLCYAANTYNLVRTGSVVEIDYDNNQVIILIGLKHNNFKLEKAWFDSNRLEIIRQFDKNIICKKLK